MTAILPLIILSTVVAPISVDKANHSVSISAVSTDPGIDMQLEFLLVGPNSDRDYEAMFVTEASIAEIAAAFEQAGFGIGSNFDPARCVFWPTGAQITMEPAFSNLVRQVRDASDLPILFTGGQRASENQHLPLADTNMPAAVFALYNCGQSLIQLNDSLDQSTTYGRFQPAVKIPKGQKRLITFRRGENPPARRVAIEFLPGTAAQKLIELKELAATGEIEVKCVFSPELTIREARGIAGALATIDSVRVKINGHAEGQLFYRAFLPLEKWRDRQERLTQPPEVRFANEKNFKITQIIEDWGKNDKIEPDLSEKEYNFDSIAEAAALVSQLAAKPMTIMVFASPETKLGRIYEFRRAVKGNIPNWYVFEE